MKMDLYLICYDIVEDDIRTAISNICKDFGLDRIQYSVFLGKLNKTQLNEIKHRFNDTITSGNANIHIVFICNSCSAKYQILSVKNKTDENIDENKTNEIKEDNSGSLKQSLERDKGVLIF